MSLEQDLTTVPGQLYALISLVGPELPQRNEKFGLKIRGVFNTREEAANHAKRLQKEDATFDIYVVDMYKWLLIPPDREKIDDVHYQNEKLEEIFTKYRDNQRMAAAMFEKRNELENKLREGGIVATKQQLKKNAEKAFKEDNQVLVEEFISGREFTIGVFKSNGEIITLPMTEIISKNDCDSILNDLRYENDKWFFTDTESAKKFAMLSLYFTKELWGSDWNCVFYKFFVWYYYFSFDVHPIFIFLSYFFFYDFIKSNHH